MQIHELDVVKLKNGESGTVLEIFNENAFMIEISDEKGQTISMPVVKADDIAEITYHYN